MKQLLRNINHTLEGIDTRLAIIQDLLEEDKPKQLSVTDVPKMPLSDNLLTAKSSKD